MSAEETVVDAVDRITLVRGFEVPLADAWDGRTLDVRIVPYNVRATVADPPSFRPYEEMFLPGVFKRQLDTPGRDKVWLNVEHEQGFRGAIGHSLRFRDGDDGLHGAFGVDAGTDGDKALRLVTSGFLSGLSLEFRALSSRRVDGVVQRVRAHLDKVSLCRYPAYADAAVLAVREEPGDEPDDGDTVDEPLELGEFTRSSDIDTRLAALGFEPLMRAGTTTASWDGSASRFTDEQYARSTLFCRPGDGSPKERCSLPVLEPDGTLNVNALGAAAAALSGGRTPLANVSPAMKASAARKLIRYYNQVNREVPESLRRLAGAG